MSTNSAIEWTEATWNPTTGCDRTSPGCDNCYALTLAKRLKAMGSSKYQVDGDPRTSGPGFGLTVHEDALSIPTRWKTPRMIFVNSMSDLFHPDVPLEFIERVFAVMADTPRHTFQVLTKRSKRLARVGSHLPWPPNVWMGVSVETSKYAFRLEHLRSVDAAVRFVSAEPLLGPLDGPGSRGHRLAHRWRRSRAVGEAGRVTVGAESPRSVRRRWRCLLLQAMGWPHAQGRWARARWCASRRAARSGGLVGHGRPGLLRIEEPAGGAEARFADCVMRTTSPDEPDTQPMAGSRSSTVTQELGATRTAAPVLLCSLRAVRSGPRRSSEK